MGSGLAGMALGLCFFLIAPTVQAQHTPPAFTSLVQPRPGSRPLGEVLAELSRQSRLPFSYSSSLVPIAHRCVLRPGPPRPLAAVLREILATEGLSFGVVGEQLVLWPAQAGVPAGVVAVNGQPGRAAPRAGQALQPRAWAAAGTSTSSGPAYAPLTNAEDAQASPVMPSARLNSNAGGGQRKPLISQAPSTPMPPPPASFGQQSFIRKKPAPAAATVMTTEATKTTTAAAASMGRTLGTKKAAEAAATVKAAPLPAPAAAVARQRHRRAVGPGAPERSVTRASAPGSRRLQLKTARMGLDLTPVAAVGRKGRASLPHQRLDKPMTALERPATAPSKPGKQPTPLPAYPSRAAMPLLAPVAVQPSASIPDGGLPPVLLPNPVPAAATDAKAAAEPDSEQRQPTGLVTLVGRKYLHGEATLGETLLLSGVGKVGFERAYLVLGAGIVGGGRQGGGSFSIGLGTAGRARGRFTPSLDVLGWFLNGDREEGIGQNRLLQLRPALAWQIKPGSRWQLIGGPTLNLATSHNEGASTDRWQLGHDQWLWLNSSDEHGNARLWPGVQLGIRF